jgi:hypothetical protein
LFLDCPRELTRRYRLAGRVREPTLLGSLLARVPPEHHPKRASLGCHPAFVDSLTPERAPPERALLGYQPVQVHPEPQPEQVQPEPGRPEH